MRSRRGSDDVTAAVELEDGTGIEFLNVRPAVHSISQFNFPRYQTEDARLRRGLLAQLADWQGLLIRQVSEARPILATLLADRMIFTAARTPRGLGMSSGAWPPWAMC
jgi:hypothetical protein